LDFRFGSPFFLFDAFFCVFWILLVKISEFCKFLFRSTQKQSNFFVEFMAEVI